MWSIEGDNQLFAQVSEVWNHDYFILFLFNNFNNYLLITW